LLNRGGEQGYASVAGIGTPSDTSVEGNSYSLKEMKRWRNKRKERFPKVVKRGKKA